MTDVAGTAPDQASRSKQQLGDLLRATEIDLRLFGMVAALAIWVGLGWPTAAILQPVNFLTFSVQAASTAILATGMVLVIVSRNIDLSVGSVVGVIGMAYAVLMADVFPTTIGVDHPSAGSSPWPSGCARGPDRRVPGLPDRLRRDPVVRRDPRRPARLPRRHLGLSGGTTSRPTPSSCSSAAGRKGSLGGTSAGSSGSSICVGDRLPARQLAGASGEVRICAPARCGPRSLSASSRARSCSARSTSPTATTGRPGSRRSTRRPTASRNRRAASRSRRGSRSRSSSSIGVTIVMTLPGHPPALRPRRLRLWRQPRRRRAGRHQHPLDDHEDLHPDGHPVRDQRGRSPRPGSTAARSTWGRATSCT